MKKILPWLILIGGAFLFYRIAGVYWMLAFIVIFLAFGFTILKLHLNDALRLEDFVFLFMVIMLGSAFLFSR
jgi:hypothetical protein